MRAFNSMELHWKEGAFVEKGQMTTSAWHEKKCVFGGEKKVQTLKGRNVFLQWEFWNKDIHLYLKKYIIYIYIVFLF